MRKVNILGTKWTVLEQTLLENNHFDICDGYCDPSIKTVFVRKYTDEECGNFFYSDRNCMQKKVTRHEIVHAFMFESGLWRNSCVMEESWSMSEEMVDWIAIQFPKMLKAFRECDCL